VAEAFSTCIEILSGSPQGSVLKPILFVCFINNMPNVVVGWLFNGTSTQKGQFVPTAGEGNRLSRLRMANKIKCILPYVT